MLLLFWNGVPQVPPVPMPPVDWSASDATVYDWTLDDDTTYGWAVDDDTSYDWTVEDTSRG